MEGVGRKKEEGARRAEKVAEAPKAAASTATNTMQLLACDQHRAQTNHENKTKELADQKKKDEEEL